MPWLWKRDTAVKASDHKDISGESHIPCLVWHVHLLHDPSQHEPAGKVSLWGFFSPVPAELCSEQNGNQGYLQETAERGRRSELCLPLLWLPAGAWVFFWFFRGKGHPSWVSSCPALPAPSFSWILGSSFRALTAKQSPTFYTPSLAWPTLYLPGDTVPKITLPEALIFRKGMLSISQKNRLCGVSH